MARHLQPPTPWGATCGETEMRPPGSLRAPVADRAIEEGGRRERGAPRVAGACREGTPPQCAAGVWGWPSPAAPPAPGAGVLTLVMGRGLRRGRSRWLCPLWPPPGGLSALSRTKGVAWQHYPGGDTSEPLVPPRVPITEGSLSPGLTGLTFGMAEPRRRGAGGRFGRPS